MLDVICTCDFLSNPLVQPVGTVWQVANMEGRALYEVPVVIFGRLAREGEPTSQCPHLAYLVDGIQPDPAR